jgi:hypothetical protein
MEECSMTQVPESTQGGWDEDVLVPVAELNEQLLELLCLAAEAVATDAIAAGTVAAEASAPAAPPLLRALNDELCTLTAPMRSRLAQCPYLLLEAGFTQPEYWQPAAFRVMDAAPAPGYFVGAEGTNLLRRSLLLAWHLARTNRVMARMTLGMTGACAERIAQCRLRDLEWLAELPPPWIRPRWHQRPEFWRRLIVAARREDPVPLRQLQWHGLTLLAARVGQQDGLLC